MVVWLLGLTEKNTYGQENKAYTLAYTDINNITHTKFNWHDYV